VLLAGAVGWCCWLVLVAGAGGWCWWLVLVLALVLVVVQVLVVVVLHGPVEEDIHCHDFTFYSAMPDPPHLLS
jgi:hypothetical protein